MYTFEHYVDRNGSYYRTIERCESEHDLAGKRISHFHNLPNGPIAVKTTDPLELTNFKKENDDVQ